MDEIKAALSEKLGSKVAFEIPLFGGIPVPQSALVTWVIIALLTVFAIWLTHGLQKKTRAPTDGCRADGGIHQQLL